MPQDVPSARMGWRTSEWHLMSGSINNNRIYWMHLPPITASILTWARPALAGARRLVTVRLQPGKRLHG